MMAHLPNLTFCSRELRMPNITTPGPVPKKETVYSGPPVQNSQSGVYRPPAPAAGSTVYNGPEARPAAARSGGTVYSGPAPGGPAYSGPGNSGTVYNPRQAAQPMAQPNSVAAKGAGLFFLVAGFSALNMLLVMAHAPFILAVGLAVVTLYGPASPVENSMLLNIVAIGVVVLIGFFVRQGSKPALLIGMLLYAADAALFLIVGDAAPHIMSIVAHGLFLIGMLRVFTQLEG
jgi:hypothetical protein